MGTAKTVGIIIMVLAVPDLLGAVLFLFSETPPIDPFVRDDADLTGYALGASGLLFLVAGMVLVFVGGRQRAPKGATASPAAPQSVEIKRTEMNWGASQAAAAPDELQEALDDVNRRIGQAKVQFGMGQLSNESYKLLMAQYEKEKGAIEAQIIKQRE